ncbi:MAG: AI-2E family transporter, partial [Methyloligellaceae bacterium]
LLPIAMVLGIFLFGQLMEGNVLSPAIVGDRVRLHPVWLIFALFVFGYLFGFVGLLVAVPVAAAIGVIVRFALEVYRESEIYHGEEEEPASPNDRPTDGKKGGGQSA